jgi:hypothetical protein
MGMGRGVESTDEGIAISMIYMTRLVLGSAQTNYQAKRISESLQEIDSVRVGRRITTGCPLASLSSRTIDCRVVPIVVAQEVERPPGSGMKHNSLPRAVGKVKEARRLPCSRLTIRC